VFEIRVRTIMAGFLEEWIRYNPTAKTQTVLRYHRIALLEAEVNPEESAFPGRCRQQQGATCSYRVNVRCSKNSRCRRCSCHCVVLADHTEENLDRYRPRQRRLSSTFQFETNRFARELRAFNYNCLLPLWDNDQRKVDLQKAASFDSHARVELANAFSPATKGTIA
jgi:hypothetical protein